jgi:hypothetical protein
MTTPEEVFEKCRKDPNYMLSGDDIKGLGRAGYRRLFELLIETPEFRKSVVDFYVAILDFTHGFEEQVTT